METADARSGVVRFGEYEADLRSGELLKSGTRIRLPGKSFGVLALLLEHPGELVTREELRARLWPGDVFVDFENNLNTAVARLREALGDSPEKPRFIETLPRRGYRFIARLPETPARAPSPARRIKLAVLPLENLSGDPTQEYFSDGMTEEMITQLASLAPERLAVIARTSAMHFKGTRKDIARIGRELGVDYVVEGSVRRADDRVRISVQLIQVSDQTHLWANSFDGGLGDILKVQSEVAQAITRRIEVTVLPAGQSCVRRAAVRPEAYDAHIKGLYHFSQLHPSGMKKAIELFELAIGKDPQYAPAYGKLATAHAWLGFFGHVAASEAFPKAEKAALAAFRVDETHPDAHHALADVHWFYHWNLAEAEREFARAVELAPNDPLHHWGLFMFLSSMREDHRRAIAESRAAIEMDPDAILAYYSLGLASLAKAAFNDAIAALLEATHRFGDNFSLAYLGMAHGLAGRRAEAREVLAQLEQRAASQDVRPVNFAWVYLGLGENHTALDWLETAYAKHNTNVLFLRCVPFYDPRRSEPRYEQLLARLNLLPRAAFGGS